jgi:hypothetical protein
MSGNDANDWAGALAALLESSQHRDPADVINDLCALAHSMGDEAAEALLDANPTLCRHVPALTQAFYQRVVRKEMAETERLLKHVWDGPVSFRDVASPDVLRTYNRVREMFERVDFRACRRFVMVGCGRLPETMFHVHDRTETTDIIGLDIVPDAIDTAREMAARFGYSRIRAELCEGQAYEFGEAQIIFITNMVSSKAAVLSRIAETAGADVQVVVREPYSLRRLWSESGERSLDPRLEVTGRGSRNSTLSQDVYLKRRATQRPQTLTSPG